MKKLFAWFYLLPMAIYWMMFVFFHWDGPPLDHKPDFLELTSFAIVKQGMMIFAGLHLYFWYKWKDK